MDDPVKVGQSVHIPYLHRRGTVREVDPSLNVALVDLHGGGERWVLLDDLEPAWFKRVDPAKPAIRGNGYGDAESPGRLEPYGNHAAVIGENA